MTQLPRLALATPATGMEPSPAALAWLSGLTENRWRVQHFRSRACPTATEAVGQVTGLPGRHLDAWLMPEAVLRRLFARGARQAELALVEGTLDDHPAPFGRPPYDQPGRLRPLADALDLPVVAVVPCPGREGFHLPRIPDGVDAVFLDGLEDPDDFEAFRRMVTLTTKKPVLGAVEALPEVRAALREAPRDRPLPDDLFGPPGCELPPVRRPRRDPLPRAEPPVLRPAGRARAPARHRRFRVAYAQDEAFGGYFPDTLEALESLGADLVEFSPLARRDPARPRRPRDDRLRLPRPPRRRPGREPQPDRLAPRSTSAGAVGSTPKGAARPTSAGR